MMKVFDYMFYRIAKRYYKTDGSFAMRGIGIVSLAQVFVLIDTGIIALFPFISFSEFKSLAVFQSIPISNVSVGVVIVLMILNYLRYRGKYSDFEERWNNEEKSKQRVKGWIVFFGSVLPVVLFFFLPKILGLLF
ncbi:MAG: hypothetical protein HRT61_08220 [Ekhidna sp.]|nr:hypothetical protein [Ekhidna sp.]